MNFVKIADKINIKPIRKEIKDNAHLWRKAMPGIKPWQAGYTHRKIEVIGLRMTHIPPDAMDNPESFKRGSDELLAWDLPEYDLFPETRKLVYKIMSMVNGGIIGRVGIICLPPGKEIDGHYDTGLAAQFFNRYHIMINGAKENWMQCGEGEDEHYIEMLTGECWLFDHQKWHAFYNRSNEPRIYLNIDIK